MIKSKKMLYKYFQFVFLIILFAAFSLNTNAQQKEEPPQMVKENLARNEIERTKKEYENLLKRGEEALKLSEELEKSFAKNNTLSAEDRKKLEKLEKIIKKIRSDLGGGDDKEDLVSDEENPVSNANGFKVLMENTKKLVDELKKSTRYTISAVAIQSTNFLLKVVKFLRFGK